jgi:4-diphosphocytidyl-2-C-methyl-D-erythritol kinase
MKFPDMVVFPKSKINLGLRITGKRNDGYHNIETIFYPVNLCDALEIVPNPDGKDDQLKVSGINSSALSGDNLVIRAIRKLRDLFPLPFFKIHLYKLIPAGAGLGGGSSDAAFTLKLLNRFGGLAMSPDDLREVALQIGSDCPFFIDSVPAYATGRGENLEPVEFIHGNHNIVLLNRGIAISTREAFRSCNPGIPGMKFTEIIKQPVNKWKDLLVNDFERSIFPRYPEIEALRDGLYGIGALYSSMSGSGSTVYGIFDRKAVLPESLGKYAIYQGEL